MVCVGHVAQPFNHAKQLVMLIIIIIIIIIIIDTIIKLCKDIPNQKVTYIEGPSLNLFIFLLVMSLNPT